MTEKPELKERLIEFVKSLLALCPAYNQVSRTRAAYSLDKQILYPWNSFS
jgi:hypothetical protein